MVQMDGSTHEWIEARGRRDCLMVMCDDARSVRLAFIDEEETSALAMRTVWEWIKKYGVPQSLYTDRKNVYITDREPTLEEQLAGVEPLTAFGKACAKLGIHIITAHSPQAKGRVERGHGIFQDRFVKEMWLQEITTLDEANDLLHNGFLDDMNARFAIEPACPVDAHRPVPKGIDLADVFCFEEDRSVGNDWTIRYENAYYQIEKGNRPQPRPREKVTVRIRLDGTMAILFRDKPLRWRPIGAAEVRSSAQDKTKPDQPAASKKPKPAPTNQERPKTPWRQGCTLMFADAKKNKKP